jgi:protein-tyrosine phosphatase
VPARLMIDIHCHILPGLDDGASSIELSLDMARMAVADGIGTIVCTPHVTPGLYDNDGATIAEAVAALRRRLAKEGIALRLETGADVHMAPDLARKLGRAVPTLAGSRYFLFEPPHHVAPPRLDAVVRGLLAAGFVPILTHPERLTWLDGHYGLVHALSAAGMPIQVTAGSVTGAFGRQPRYWAERLLDDGLVDILASDAHNTGGRPPLLSKARDAVALRLSEAEAEAMTFLRPAAILANESLPPRAGPIMSAPQSYPMQRRLAEWFRRLWSPGSDNAV